MTTHILHNPLSTDNGELALKYESSAAHRNRFGQASVVVTALFLSLSLHIFGDLVSPAIHYFVLHKPTCAFLIFFLP
jgi:hypothetical protein